LHVSMMPGVKDLDAIGIDAMGEFVKYADT
jgi:hypothetical protein